MGHPAVTAALAATQNRVLPAAVRNAIGALVDAGVLTKVSAGRRDQMWVAEEITACCDRLAVLRGRRQEW